MLITLGYRGYIFLSPGWATYVRRALWVCWLVSRDAMSTPFGMAGTPEFLHAPGAVARTLAAGAVGQPVKSKPVGVAGLAPSGITSTPFGTTGSLELGQPEPPSA